MPPAEEEEEGDGEVIRPRRLQKLREIQEEDEDAQKDKDQDMNE